MNQRATETTLINTLVDTMSMEDFCNKLTLNELINEIKYTLDDEMLDEFITTIKEDSKD